MSLSYAILTENLKLSKAIIYTMTDVEQTTYLFTEQKYRTGLNECLRYKPDLIFVDMDTFASAKKLVHHIRELLKENISFIGLSKGKKYAYRAIKLRFKDYLIYPIDELQLRKAMLSIQQSFTASRPKTICVQSREDYLYIDAAKILFLKADNNTTDIHLTDGRVICSMKMLKIFERTLPPTFLRIHRSYIINSNQIKRIDFSRSRCMIGQKLERIPFTKSYDENIKMLNERLNQQSLVSII